MFRKKKFLLVLLCFAAVLAPLVDAAPTKSRPQPVQGDDAPPPPGEEGDVEKASAATAKATAGSDGRMRIESVGRCLQLSNAGRRNHGGNLPFVSTAKSSICRSECDFPYGKGSTEKAGRAAHKMARKEKDFTSSHRLRAPFDLKPAAMMRGA